MRTRYTLTREQAETAIREVVTGARHPEKWKIWIGETAMMASAPATYRLTFNDGGLTARKSSRSDRWKLYHGIG